MVHGLEADLAAQRARAEAAEVEATDLRNGWGELSYRLAQVEAERDRERQRAEAAELKAGELDKEADVFCQAYRWMITDRDRERQRAERLAARVAELEGLLTSIRDDSSEAPLQTVVPLDNYFAAFVQQCDAALRGAEGAGE